jgi:hypothetical protein
MELVLHFNNYKYIIVSSNSLSCGGCFMELGISKFWNTSGYFWDSCYLAVQLVEWVVREAFLDIWNMVSIFFMWTIWKERNQCTFENVYRLDKQILESFTLTLSDWSRTWGFTTSSSKLNSLHLCIYSFIM